MNLKRYFGLIIFLFAGMSLATGIVYAYSQKNTAIKDPADYKKLWKNVEAFESKGLTDSALKTVMTLYQHAKTEGNTPQLVKTIIYRMKYNVIKEEFAAEKNIALLLSESKTAKFPANAILQNMLGEAYWTYYEQNRWQYYERSKVSPVNEEDLSTYDLTTILERAIQYYRLSIEDAQALKQIRLDEYDYILNAGDAITRTWRPTLYDLLCHRALEVFSNSEADVTRPADQVFTMNSEIHLKPYTEFMNAPLDKPADKYNLTYYAVLIYQDLLKFHAAKNNTEALADLELKRLVFVKNRSQNQHLDSLYLQNIKWQCNHFKTSSRLAEFKHLEAVWWQQQAEHYDPLESEAHQWDRKKAVDICQAILKEHKGSRGANQAQNTLNQLSQQSLLIRQEDVCDEKIPNRILVKYTNSDKVYFKIMKVGVRQFPNLSGHVNANENFKTLLKLPLVKTFESPLPDDKDFNPHSVEVAMPGLEPGNYVLLASVKPDFSTKENTCNYQPFTVSNLAFLRKYSPDGTNEFNFVNRQSGQPVGDVNVSTWLGDYNYNTHVLNYQVTGTFKSDDKGYLKLKLTAANPNYFIILNKGNDTLAYKDLIAGYDNTRSQEPVTNSYLFTDRSIYRPGQTIYFKSIVFSGLNNRYEVKPNFPLTLTFYDVNGEKISSQNLSTNEYGTVAGSFVAPQGLLTGEMRISDGITSNFVSVEEYKRPKFEVLFDTLKTSYKLNESVTVKGLAKAFAGNPVDGASVSYRVVRQVNYPYWYDWYKPFYSRAAETEISNGTVKTNNQGEFEIKFEALADASVNKNDQADFTFQLIADVTDINGETRGATNNLRLGYKSIRLQFVSPEIVNTGNLPKMSLIATNLNGVETTATGTLSVYELNQPTKLFRTRQWEQPDRHILSREDFYKMFPHDLYDDELNQYKWARTKRVISRNFNTKSDKDVVMPEFKTLKPGVYCVEAVCKDRQGEDVKSLDYITVYSSTSPALPYPMATWQVPLNTTVEPGDKASFIFASSYESVFCLYSTESDGGHAQRVISPSLKPIEIPIEEKNRGGLIAEASFIKYGRFYHMSQLISVPFSNKEIDVQFSTFRTKLLPGQDEEWKVTLKNKKGDQVAAELLATLYDASLDKLKPHHWSYYLYNNYNPKNEWSSSIGNTNSGTVVNTISLYYPPVNEYKYDALNNYGLLSYRHGWGRGGGKNMMLADVASASYEVVSQSLSSSKQKSNRIDKNEESGLPESNSAKNTDTENNSNIAKQSLSTQVKTRKNFNETAFFFPQLNTNSKGEVVLKFTMPESLTRWKFMALAHSKDLMIGQAQKECITQKDLMAMPNPPRFLREGDEFSLAGKISNLSDKDLTGTAELRIYDAITEKDLSSLILKQASQQNFNSNKGNSVAVEWKIKIPEGLNAVKYKITATAGNFSDGEEAVLPVLSNKLLVTESMPLPIRGAQSKTFSFTKFINRNNNSNTLKDHAYTIEFTSNPAWFAVQSLPYLMEYPYECAEQTFSRYYSNALAAHMANSKPQIKAIFEAWKNQSPETFLSNLEKNQELKAVLLQETPWVLQSKNESENKKRLGLLFDLNHMSNELNMALNKLEAMQTSSGGWPWFNGGPEDWYISQHILSGLAHLKKLGVIDDKKESRVAAIMTKALSYCDAKFLQSFKELKRLNKNYQKENRLGNMEIQYLYTRSYFNEAPMDKELKEAFNYYKKQEQTYWLKQPRYLQAMIALNLNRYSDKKTALGILASLKQNALNSEEMGMYWKENYSAYYWYQAPIEMQAMMIEAFSEVSNDVKAVESLKTWLIKSKQTQNWKSTRATTEAIYALLLRGENWLNTEPNVQIQLGSVILDLKNDASLKTEAGTGYFKKTFTGNEIQANMGQVKVTKTGNGVAWGSVYWQYFEQLDKITSQQTPLSLVKKLFLVKNTASGPILEAITENSNLKVGDKLKVRIELRCDRDMEYLHLKDMRAAGLEPVNVLSAYKYQDGLGYYESTGDAASNFFISYLPKGSYVFEYAVYVSHKGQFNNGISSIQCLYAPEFTSHSEGVRLNVSGGK